MSQRMMFTLGVVVSILWANPSGAASMSFLLKWGSVGSGPGKFNFPLAIAVGPGDEVYVSDTGNNGIQVFDANGNYLRRFFASLPRGIAFGPNGHLYVVNVETQFALVTELTPDGNEVRSWGGYGSAPGQFVAPFGITVDQGGHVYVADTGNNRIEKFTSDGSFELAWGQSGSGHGQFVSDYGVVTGLDGSIYVADDHSRLQEFTPDSTYIREWGGIGSTNGKFGGPRGMAVDADGNVYVADAVLNDRIQVFSSTGAYLAQFGSSGTGDGQFNQPFGVAINSAGDVYVLDTANNRIQKFTATVTPTMKSTWGALKGLFR